MKLCGPKLSIVGLLLSSWGILMLALLGIFFKIHSVALVEDLSIPPDVLKANKPDDILNAMNTSYQRNAYSCWTAACLYILTFVFSLQQYYSNRRAHSSI